LAVPIFLSYPQLKEHGIPWSRVHINNLMAEGLFPPNQQLSANRVGWNHNLILEFLNTRPAAGEPMPRLWPRRQRPAKPPARKLVGRPRGSRVVVDADGRRRLVMPLAADVVS
jgi:predicted DNA-binding transcriptional regulator AlpA